MSAMTSPTVFPEAVSLVSPPVASRNAPGRRTVTATVLLPKGSAQITLSPISDQHDDMAGLFPRDRQPRGDRRTAGDAAEDALLAGEPSRHRDRVVRAHDAMLVGDRGVPDRRAGRRGHVLPAFDPVQRPVRLARAGAA